MARETKQRKFTRNQARAARRVRRQKRRGLLKAAAFTGIGAVAALLIISLFLPSLNFNFGGDTRDGPGLSFPIQGRAHIAPEESHPPYNTTPPTSGWHYENPAPWGVSSLPIPDEVQVHNLEHGGIMLQYDCDDGCDDLVQNLTQVASRYRHTIVAPYSEMDTRIALTAWGWIDTFDEFEQTRVVDFIETHIDRGPERVP